MKDAQHLDQANVNMAKVKRLGKITHILFLPLIIGSVLFAISTVFKPSQSASKIMGEELAKYRHKSTDARDGAHERGVLPGTLTSPKNETRLYIVERVIEERFGARLHNGRTGFE